MRPEVLEELIKTLNSLPGISKKIAQRVAMFLVLESDSSTSIELQKILDLTSKNLRKCIKCNHITDLEICSICSDKSRKKTLIVVETSDDVFKFEDKIEFKPKYHVLGGLINIAKNIEFDELWVENLVERAKEFDEIIIALSATLEGVVTTKLIKKILYNFNVTELAQGIPLGAAMEYIDELTLKIAIENRKEVK